MSDAKPASPQPPMLTVALDLPSAQVLADQASIVQDLQFVVECCKRLLTELDIPEEDRDPVVPQALWSAALASYTRCFSKGKRFGLGPGDITSLPLEGEVVTFHKWVAGQRTKLTTHPADPFEAAKVGAALALPGRGERRVEGIAILTTSRVLVDDTGVRQLGALAAALARQTAERAQEQQDTVLEEAQQRVPGRRGAGRGRFRGRGRVRARPAGLAGACRGARGPPPGPGRGNAHHPRETWALAMINVTHDAGPGRGRAARGAAQVPGWGQGAVIG